MNAISESLVFNFFYSAVGIMARGPRRLRNLNLEAEDAEVEQQGHDDFAGNENEGNLQGPPDVDNMLAHMPTQRASPIKIICKYDIFFPLHM